MTTAPRLGWLEIKLLIRETPHPRVSRAAIDRAADSAGLEHRQPVFYRGGSDVLLLPLPGHRVGVRDQHPDPPRRLPREGRAQALPGRIVGAFGAIAGSELLVAFALILLVAARLVYNFDFAYRFSGAIAVFCSSTVGFTAIGLLLGGLVPRRAPRRRFGLLIWFVMLMVGGAPAATRVSPAPWGCSSDATPLWYAVQMMISRGRLGPAASWWVFTGVAAHQRGAPLLFRWD